MSLYARKQPLHRPLSSRMPASMQKAPSGVAKTHCSFIGVSHCDEELLKDEAFQDQLGYWWCEKHKIRGLLLNYAVQHKYPVVMCADRRFAIGNGHDADCWKVAILMGHEDFIQAIATELGLSTQQGEVA